MTQLLTSVFTLCLLSTSVDARAQGLSAARMAARSGNVDAAIADLTLAPKTADANALLCQLYGSIEKRDEAVRACEAAAKAAPTSSEFALELARAYGNKANNSGALTGMRMVGKIRSNFERAVELDGGNVDALSDLGQFYVEAPGIVGGGTNKARPIVAKLQALAPARAHRLAGMIAAKENDEVAATREFEAELAVAHSPEAYVDLATFYRSRKDLDRAGRYAQLAIERDVHHGPDTLDAAGILIELKMAMAAAQTGLRNYLNTPQTGAVARFAKAHVLLGKSLEASGETAGANKEFAAALALAHDYDAARKGAAQ